MRTSIKKTIAFALTLCAISAGIIAPNAGKFTLSQTSIVASAAELKGDYYYELSGNNASIVGYVGNSTYLTLPSQVTINNKTYKVTKVASSAFSKNSKLYSVKIPSGYTSIGNSAFMYCSNLTYVDMPSTITELQDYAFYATGLKSFTIPSKVTSIGLSAFSGCHNLVDVSIKTTYVSKLSDNMFSNCWSLRNITFSSGIKTLGASFATGCTSLKAITLPYGLKTIENDAFLGCTSLSSISIPSTVTTIGSCAFQDTAWIKAQPKTNGLVIRNNNILDASSASGTVNIPSGITRIPEKIFEGNRNITKVIMPSSVKEIGSEAFCNCTNLIEVQFSNSITEIPVKCFKDCTKISSISLPSTIKTINQDAFCGCTSLSSITLPNQLTTIGEMAFENCTALTNISGINFNKNYNIDGKAFEGCMKLKKLNGNTVVSRSGYNVSLYQSNFVKEYFSKTDNIGFIQDFIDKKTSAVVDQIKSQHPSYNQTQMALALEEWLCAYGSDPFENWKKVKGNENYPNDLEKWEEYHRESSVLMNGVGVCEGWAKGYYRLLKKAGIWSEVTSGNNHNYNAVYLDGIWFNVDSYWDDNGNRSDHTWFLVSADEANAMDDDRHCHNTSGTLDPDNNYLFDNYYHNCNHPLGDVNLDCVLDRNDYNLIYAYVYNNSRPKTFHLVCADMNFDGKINSDDVNLLKKKANIR